MATGTMAITTTSKAYTGNTKAMKNTTRRTYNNDDDDDNNDL